LSSPIRCVRRRLLPPADGPLPARPGPPLDDQPGEDYRVNTHRADPPAETGRRGPILAAPVRRWLYGIAAAAAPLVTVYGLVTEQEAVLWLNLVGSLLFTVAVGNTPARGVQE